MPLQKSTRTNTILTIIVTITVLIIFLDNTWWLFFSLNIQGTKIDHLAEKKNLFLCTVHTLSVCRSLVRDANLFAPQSYHGDSSYYGNSMFSVSRVCVCLRPSCRDFVGKMVVTLWSPSWLIWGLLWFWVPPPVYHCLCKDFWIFWSAICVNCSFTQLRVLKLRPRWILLILRVWGPVTESIWPAVVMSLWGGALVLLVYGGLFFKQSKTQMAAPAPCEIYEHYEKGINNCFKKNLMNLLINKSGNTVTICFCYCLLVSHSF